MVDRADQPTICAPPQRDIRRLGLNVAVATTRSRIAPPSSAEARWRATVSRGRRVSAISC